MHRRFAVGVLVFLSSFGLAQAKPQPASGSNITMEVRVDATDASRNLLHGRLHLQAVAGPMTLVYPKWIPGEHAPTGPVVELVGIHVLANGKEIPWTRDSVDMYAFQFVVPAGGNTIDVQYDEILPANASGFSSAASSSANLLMLSWNQVLLYPIGANSDAVQVNSHLKMPQGWKFGTALPVSGQSGQEVDFKTASLTTLVDSPVLMGAYFKTIPLGNDLGREHFFDIAADSNGALAVPEPTVAALKQLVRETGALFGARHYRDYHFLVTLSDTTAHFGLEHHESSDDRTAERTFIDDTRRWRAVSLYSHEMTHSWNGKYRRPAGLATANYQDPMKGDLLWVYEGLTQYLGMVLPARAGLWTPEQFREEAAAVAADLDHSTGRTWRPLQDTATAAQLLYGASPNWAHYRRGVDYYPEGFLLWLEADTIIRQESKGQRSLDDFCHKFHGGTSGDPQVVTYTFDDIVSTLNSVQPYDWRGFWTEHLQSKSPRAPLGGINKGGWKLSYTDKRPKLVEDTESDNQAIDAQSSIGLSMNDKGEIRDAIIGSPAERAGIAPGMKIIAINGRTFKDGKQVHEAIAATKESKAPLEMIVANGEFIKTYSVDYHEGEKYPVLVRDESTPDLLSQIIASKAGAEQKK